MRRRSVRNQLANWRPRGAFTLIELLVAIVIIAILMAFIVPAVGGARRTARIAEVSQEIKGLDAGLTEFKSTFNTFPPSRITLYEEATGWAGDTKSRAVIRKLFPRFDFSYSHSGGDIDINGDGDTTDVITLTGPECLVFFLGGIQRDGATTGFSKNQAHPFNPAGKSRIGPFFEFKTGERLVDLDADGMFEYLDTLPGQANPFLYVSANNGKGYNAADMVLGTTPLMTAVYRTGPNANDPPHKPKTYQIISPGFDTNYGTGGEYNAEDADTDFLGAREAERDNMTNFRQGTLAN